MLRIILILAGVAVAAAVVWAWATSSTAVDTAAAERRAISRYIAEEAKTRLPRTHLVTMPIEGRILPVEPTEGDRVAAGQVVARLETDDLDTAVAMARARVERLEASIVENNDARLEESTLVELDSVLESVDRSVEAAQAETEASLARQDYRAADLRRKQEAFERNAATRLELDEAELSEIESRIDYRTDVLTLRALQALRQAVRIWPLQVRQIIEKKTLKEAVLRHELAEARAALDQAVRDRERALVRAPVDGVVLSRIVSSGQVLPAGSPLLEIGRLEDLEVEVEVLSQEAVGIGAGDPAEIVVATVSDVPLAGAVTRVEPKGFTKVSSLGVEQQRVLVIVGFDAASVERFRAAGYALGVGYRVQARIFTETRADAVVVARPALFRGDDGGWRLFAVRRGRARLTPVEVGLANESEAQVLRGLDPGDLVILAPETGLEDGARVKARPRSR